MAPDAAAAVAAAASTGEPVVIDELTDEYTRHFANPDGTRTFEQHVVAQRVRRAGGWTPVDTTLRVVNGRVVPGATVLDMSFSAGGTGELVSLSDGDVRLGLSWPAPLPEPVLSGDTATYREVLPGVDLVVRADPESFAQLLVVKNRQAATNPALGRIAWDVAAEGLTLRTRADGAVEAVDHTGEVAFHAPASLMWDSPPPPAAAPRFWPAGEAWQASVAGETPGTVTQMPVQASATELVVRPDLRLLTDPGTAFPVMIDPSFDRDPSNWAPVNKADPNRSYPSGSSWPRDTVRVGETWGVPGMVFRSHLRFSISSMDGQDLVGNPSFHITLDHSASCGDTPVELWRTNTIGSGDVTWNSMASKWLHGGPLQTRSAHANEDNGCGANQPDVPMEFSNSNIRTRVQEAMDDGNSTFTFGLRAPNESDEFQWKRFLPGSAKLTAVYNLIPAAPTNLAITGGCYPGACSSPAMVRTRQPTLRAKVTDPNGDTMRVRFEVRNASKSSVVASTEAVTNVSSGSSPTWKAPTLPQESQFHFRVRAKDSVGWGPWSGYYTFYVDTLAPAPPTVSGELYQHKDTGTYNGGVGQPGSFTFGAAGSDDVISYQWKLQGGTITTVNVLPGAGHQLDITPTGDLEQLLEVRSIDHAGNASAWQEYPFYVRPEPVDVAYWKFDEGAGTTAATALDQPQYEGILQGGASWAPAQIGLVNPGASGTAVALDGTDDYVATPRVLATNHAAGFSVSAWVRPDTLTGYHTVVAQHGENTYAFRLYYKPETDRWCFRVRQADDTAAGNTGVCSTLTPQAGVWTHLAGIYDRPAGKLRLYVNGGQLALDPEFGQGSTDEVTAPPMWASAGAFTVGRVAGASAGWWDGRIDEVRAYQRVLAEADVRQMYLSCRFDSCPSVQPVTEPVLVAAWDLDDGAGTVASDASGLGGHATLSGGAAWTTASYGGPSAVRLDGFSSSIETAGPVLLTDQSFTVSAWVELDDYDGYETVLSQAGNYQAAVRLHYHLGNERYCFLMYHADEEGSPFNQVCGPQQPQLGVWTHLAGVYDAAARTMTLYIDGQPVQTVPYTGLAPWQAGGVMRLGRSLYTAVGGTPTIGTYFDGTIDSVRVYQGAMSSTQMAGLYAEQLDRTPTAVVDTPAASATWTAGATVSFSGHGTDPQGALPTSALSWQLRLVDCTVAPCQTEVLQEWTGVAAGSFTAPDAEYPAHLELALTADNGSGELDTAVVQLNPATVNLTFASAPAGLDLVVDSVAGVTPFVRTVIRNSGVDVDAPSPQDLGGDTYLFESWSDGGEQAHAITAPAAATTYTAGYTAEQDLTPTATITAPAPSVAWSVGAEIAFSGQASDPQGALPASALSWQLRLVDCTVAPCRSEVLDDWSGVPSGSFVAPDVEYPSHLELELTADNGPGLVDTAVVQVNPATVNLTFASDPAGLDLVVDSVTGVTPFVRTVIRGSSVDVEAPGPQELGGASYLFQDWSDGGDQAHAITAPAAATTYTASYLPVGTGCGVDSFGYTCAQGPRAFLPTTEVLPLSGYFGATEVALPFPVWLYGGVYDTAWVGVHGAVTFLDEEWTADAVSTIPSAREWAKANAAVYPFWNDWVVDEDASVRTGLVGSAPDRQFVVEWRDVAPDDDSSLRVSFQAVFHESGEITVAWDGIGSAPVEQGAAGVVGIENLDGTVALAYSQFTAALSSGQGVTFTPPPAGTIAGTVTDGSGTPVPDVTVRLNPGGQSAATDAGGGYTFTDVPVGTHGVFAAHPDGACAGPQASGLAEVSSGQTAVADLEFGSGSDQFGYTCVEGPTAFLPTTNVLALDGYYGDVEVALPFPVSLYGQNYSTAWVDVEGVVTLLEEEWTVGDVSPIPSPHAYGQANAAVYPFWQNWVVDEDASVRTGLAGSAPNRTFVIEWRNVLADSDFYSRASFQVVFHESGEIGIAWADIDPSLVEQGIDAIIGIENADGTDAFVHSEFAPTIMDGWGALFQPPGS